VTAGSRETMTNTLTATGSSVTILSATTASAEFQSGWIVPPQDHLGWPIRLILCDFHAAGQWHSVGQHFPRQQRRTPSTDETLTGSATKDTQRSVSLSWVASSSSVVGYNVYRSGTSGGPYTTTTPAANTSYIDTSVQGGQTYYYVNTVVDSVGAESKSSTQVRALIPREVVHRQVTQ
jgi:hypothetical protein